MSFLRTLATVAVGVAAAKGASKYKQMGGMAGLQDMFAASGGTSGMVDQLSQMAEKMGVPGAGNAMRDMMANFGGGSGAQPEAAAAGFGGLMAAMGGAAAAGGKQADDVMASLFKGTPVGMAAEDNAKLMIRAMIQAAKADGEIDAAEQQTILDAIKDSAPEEVAFVKAELAAPVDAMALAQDTGDAMKAQVYSTSLMAIRVDHEHEVAYLRQLADGLGLDRATRDRVHAAMGVPPLPA
ncbi:DUF533 domain-containing protein [Meridianimarinicoccus roseus]|uniref:DUF533 domain-containing protein n=1 Tax=Meridianimarinicoccus roseus TaxID=2072018 RepID=A0A2V2LA29_9RHOB|nr:DUF533 domain-containing protein [Meridianimarinicoccus roseus]PWR02310.1 DUF533 domain-containing protein [Meridianimarinicoccus roseus]